MLTNAHYNSYTDPLYVKLKKYDIYEQVLLFMHDWINNKLPISFNGMFTLNRDRPKARETRQSDLLYEAPCKRIFAKRLPTYKYPTIWNYWATRINLSGSKNQSKHLLKTRQLSSHQTKLMCVQTEDVGNFTPKLALSTFEQLTLRMVNGTNDLNYQTLLS